MTWQPEPRQLQAERAVTRQRALSIACEYCGAEVGRECYDPRTGVVLVHQPAHMWRLQGVS